MQCLMHWQGKARLDLEALTSAKLLRHSSHGGFTVAVDAWAERTINIKDDTLGTRLQQEEHALAEGVILRQQAHNGVVPGLLGNPGRHWHAIKLALQEHKR